MGQQHLALLGCGRVARQHARTLRKMGVLVSFASRELWKARAYQQKFGGVYAIHGYEGAFAAVQEPGDYEHPITGVVDCTPPHRRFEHVQWAVRYSVPLLLEKPVSWDLERLMDMRQLLPGHGNSIMVAENYLYKPLRRVVQKLLRGIGTPVLARINVMRQSLPVGWLSVWGNARGPLWEGGIHWFALLRAWFGECQSVLMQEYGYHPGLSSVVLYRTHAPQFLAELVYSWNTPARLNGLGLSRIVGEHGSIYFETNGLFVVSMRGRVRTRIALPWRDITGTRAMFREFLTLTSGRSVVAQSNLYDASYDIAALEAAYRSRATRRWEDVWR